MAKVKHKESYLSHRQQLWVLHYCKAHGENNRAPCGYASKKIGLNESTGRLWFTQTNIKIEINRRMTEVGQAIFDKYAVTQDRIIRRYAQIAFHDINDTLIPDPAHPNDPDKFIVQTLPQMDEDVRMGLGAKVSDVKSALDSLSRIEGMFNDKIEVTNTFKDILKDIEKMDGSDEPLVNEDD